MRSNVDSKNFISSFSMLRAVPISSRACPPLLTSEWSALDLSHCCMSKTTINLFVVLMKCLASRLYTLVVNIKSNSQLETVDIHITTNNVLIDRLSFCERRRRSSACVIQSRQVETCGRTPLPTKSWDSEILPPETLPLLLEIEPQVCL